MFNEAKEIPLQRYCLDAGSENLVHYVYLLSNYALINCRYSGFHEAKKNSIVLPAQKRMFPKVLPFCLNIKFFCLMFNGVASQNTIENFFGRKSAT